MNADVHPRLEPDVQDILDDPIFLAVLRRDGLTINDILLVIKSYREKKSGTIT